MFFTIDYLVEQAQAMENTLREKGMTSPDVEITLNYTDSRPFRVGARWSLNHIFQHIEQPYEILSPEETLAHAWSQIRQLKTAEEERKRQFLKSFGNLLDEARELDLDVEFINPLEESMRKLSENILEDQRND